MSNIPPCVSKSLISDSLPSFPTMYAKSALCLSTGDLYFSFFNYNWHIISYYFCCTTQCLDIYVIYEVTTLICLVPILHHTLLLWLLLSTSELLSIDLEDVKNADTSEVSQVRDMHIQSMPGALRDSKEEDLEAGTWVGEQRREDAKAC